MRKRILASLIIMAILASLLASCSPAAQTTTGTAGATTTKAAQATTTVGTTAAGTTEPESDDVTVTAPGELPLASDRVTLTLGITQNPRISDYDDNYMTNLIRDECGIDLEFELLPADQPQQKFQLMVSAKQELPDIVHFSHGVNLSNAQRSAYGREGIFVPLNDYMEDLTFWYKQADMDDKDYEMIKIMGTSPDGNFYGFPAYMDGTGDIIQYMTNINRVWLEKLGLDMPTTTDEFRDVLIAFRDNDPNENGKKDEIPFLAGPAWSGNVWQEMINYFVYFDPWYPTSFFNVTDGELWAPFITDEYRDALRYLYDLVDEGLLSPLSFSMTGEEHRATVDLAPGETNTVGVIGGHYVVLWAAENEHVYDYDAMPALKGPQGVSYSPTREPNFMFSTFITKDNPYPEISFRLFDYWWDEKRSLTVRYGEPGVHWEYYKDDLAGFNERYPYPGSGSMSLGLEQGKHSEIKGVQNPWTSTEPHNVIWGTQFCCGLAKRVYSASATWAPAASYWGEAVEKDMGVSAHRTYLNVSYFQQRYGLEPPETAKQLLFTDEEEENINELRTTINSYIMEAASLFATGGMDIEKDWDSYIQSLKDMGLETYLNTSQAAYDRMYK